MDRERRGREEGVWLVGRACRRCRTTTERSIEMNDGVSSSVVVGLLHCPIHTSMLALGTPVLDESMEMRMYLPTCTLPRRQGDDDAPPELSSEVVKHGRYITSRESD